MYEWLKLYMFPKSANLFVLLKLVEFYKIDSRCVCDSFFDFNYQEERKKKEEEEECKRQEEEAKKKAAIANMSLHYGGYLARVSQNDYC